MLFPFCSRGEKSSATTRRVRVEQDKRNRVSYCVAAHLYTVLRVASIAVSAHMPIVVVRPT